MRSLLRQAFLTWAAGAAMSLARGQDVGDLRLRDGAHTKMHFTAPGYLSLHDWQARREQLRRQILVSAGLWPLNRREPLHTRTFGGLDGPGYSVSRLAFETLPGFWVGANLYLPNKPGRKFPAVLVPHGHWKHGRVEHNSEYSVPALAVNLAAQGYAVLTYDMVGYNDTRQLPHKFGDSDLERSWSFHPLGLQLWNSIRAMDLLAGHPQVDAERIGVTGASGGGTQTFLLAAVDERVRVSLPAAMVSATFQGDDDCEVAPGLRIGASNIEIAAMAAPRPQLLIAATGDWTRLTPELEFPAIRGIYQLYDQPQAVDYAYIDAGHNYNKRSREAAYAFLWRHLAGNTGPPPRETVEFTQDPDALLIGPAISALTEGIGQEQVFARWRERSEAAQRGLTAGQRRELLQATLAITWPDNVKAIPFNAAYVLDYGAGERVPARWIASGPGRTLVVHEKGSEIASKSDAAVAALRRGDSLLLIDIFSPDAAAPRARRSDYLAFHRGDDANRIQDVLTALAFLAGSDVPVTLACPGKAAVWCAVAAAVAPQPVRLDPDLGYLSKAAEIYARIPGFSTAGGAETVAAALERLGVERQPPAH